MGSKKAEVLKKCLVIMSPTSEIDVSDVAEAVGEIEFNEVDARGQFDHASDLSRQAFDKVVARIEVLELEMASKTEQARSIIEGMKVASSRRREQIHRMRERYAVLVDRYNELAEEEKETSDSS